MADRISEWDAMPCVEMVTLEEYLEELNTFSIKQTLL